MVTNVTQESLPAAALDRAVVRPHRYKRGFVARRALLVADVAGVLIAVAAAQLVVGGPSIGEVLGVIALLPPWALGAKLFGLYSADDQRIDHSTVDEIVSVVLLTTLMSWALLLVGAAGAHVEGGGEKLLVFWSVAIVSVTAGRSVARAVLHRRPGFRQRALILGADETGRLVGRKLRQHPEYGVELVGFVDDSDGAEVIGQPAELAELVKRLEIDRVVVAFTGRPDEETLATIRSLDALDIYIDVVPRLYGVVGPNGRIHSVEGLPLIDLPPARISRSSRLVKRGLDVVGALVGLVLTAPFFLVIPFLIRRESPGPALFRQTRLGEQMRPFTVLKFRTMRDGTDAGAHREYIRASMHASAATEQGNGLFKLERTNEVTRVGAFLRRTSLDELPQLLNVLRGDMSLVGPRPCIPYETEFFAPHQFERFLVPAGLTGLWQVTARAHSSFGEALDMDVAYVRGWSIGLDLTLLLRTVKHVLTREGTA